MAAKQAVIRPNRATRRAAERRGLTAEELLALPAVVDLVTAGRAIGIGRTKAHELARAGEFPARVLRLGNTYRVVTSDLWELLGIAPAEPPQLEAG